MLDTKCVHCPYVCLVAERLHSAVYQINQLTFLKQLSHYAVYFVVLQEIKLSIKLPTRTTAAQNEVALSYYRMHGLYFLAVVFAATIVTIYMQVLSPNPKGTRAASYIASNLQNSHIYPCFRVLCDTPVDLLLMKNIACNYYYNIADFYTFKYQITCMIILLVLDQGCPTRDPRAACSPLDKLDRPILLSLSFTPYLKVNKIFFRMGKIFEGGKFSWGTKNFGGTG